MNLTLFRDEDIKHVAFPFFTKAMEGKQFGQWETWDAWQWFKSGWEMQHYVA